MEVTWQQVSGWRMARHHLDAPGGDLVAVAGRLAGVQAQVASSAELALGIRSTGAAGPAVRDALWRDRALVKSWGMRGTLHLFPAAEFPLWVAALRSRRRRSYPPGWERNFGVTPAETEAIAEAVGDVLRGQQLTREELAAAVAGKLGQPRYAKLLGSGWGALLKPAALSGELCYGPSRGQQITFVSPRDWLPGPWREPPAEEALAVVLRRFLDAYGPATEEDLAAAALAASTKVMNALPFLVLVATLVVLAARSNRPRRWWSARCQRPRCPARRRR